MLYTPKVTSLTTSIESAHAIDSRLTTRPSYSTRGEKAWSNKIIKSLSDNAVLSAHPQGAAQQRSGHA